MYNLHVVTYKECIKTNATLKDQFARHAGCARFVYNWGLDLKIKIYEKTGKSLSYNELQNMLPKLKKKHPWLADSCAQVLQQALVDLDRAFKAFYRRCKAGEKPGFPEFRSKRDLQSFRFPQRVKIIGSEVSLPTIGMVKIFNKDRLDKINAPVKQATVKLDATGKWHVAMCIEKKIKPLKPIDSVVGIDVGIKTSVTTTDGEVFNLSETINVQWRKLKRAQRKLSRKKKGSSNRAKQRKKVARIHAKIVNIRKDFHHKVSKTLVSENQVIGIEDLNLTGMVKNRKLAFAIQKQAWGQLFAFLNYKAKWHGREIVEMPRFFASSQLCGKCGYQHKKLTLADREWVCPKCRTKHHRDKNASKNIRYNAVYASKFGKCLTSKLFTQRKRRLYKQRTAGTAGSKASGENVRPLRQISLKEETLRFQR